MVLLIITSILFKDDIIHKKKINEILLKLKLCKSDFDVIYFKNQFKNIDLYPLTLFLIFFLFK